MLGRKKKKEKQSSPDTVLCMWEGQTMCVTPSEEALNCVLFFFFFSFFEQKEDDKTKKEARTCWRKNSMRALDALIPLNIQQQQQGGEGGEHNDRERKSHLD